MRDQGRVLGVQPLAAQLLDEAVVAVPAAVVVEREQGYAGGLEALESLGTTRRTGQVLGQSGVDPLHDAGLQEETAQVIREAVEHLGDQVVGDGPAVAGEVRHRPGPLRVIGTALQGQGSQSQSDRPALGALHQPLDLGVVEGQPVLAQQGDRLVAGEREVGVPDLAQATAHPQPVQRQRRVGTGDQHQVDTLGEEPHQGVDRADGSWGGHLVEVLEHDHHGSVQLLEGQQQTVQEGLVHLGGRVHPLQRRAVEPGSFERRQEEGPQPLRVVAVGAERRPCHPYAGPAAPAYPVDDEMGLAGAGTTADQGDVAAASVIHLLQQPGPGQDVGGGSRWRGPGAQQRADGA